MATRSWKFLAKNYGRREFWPTILTLSRIIIHKHFSTVLPRIISAMGCGDAFEGVAVGADMYHVQGVRAFIGPYCNAGNLLQ